MDSRQHVARIQLDQVQPWTAREVQDDVRPDLVNQGKAVLGARQVKLASAKPAPDGDQLADLRVPGSYDLAAEQPTCPRDEDPARQGRNLAGSALKTSVAVSRSAIRPMSSQ